MKTTSKAKLILAFSALCFTYGNVSAQVEAGPDQTICGRTAKLSAAMMAGAEGTWTDPTGKVTFDDPHDPHTTVRGIPDGESVSLTWTVTQGEQTIGEDNVIITNDKPVVLFTQVGQGNRFVTCADVIDLSCYTNPNYSYVWSLSSGKIANDNSSSITVTDLDLGETTVWLTIFHNNYDQCISENSMLVVNQSLNPSVKEEKLTTDNSSVLLVANEPPANATQHYWQIVESSPAAALDNASSTETMARHLREGVNKFKWVLQNDDCADAVDVTVTNTAKSEPVSLTISKFPKTQYVKGEQFDVETGKLTLTCDDGSTEEISFGDLNQLIFDANKIGPQRVALKYKEFSLSMSVYVSENAQTAALTPELKDGVYQLATPEHLYWFITQVNNGNTKINAVLTQDIVINADCLSRLSLAKKDNDEFGLIEWQPIGTPENPFEGTFNGDGHSVSGLYINSNTDDNVGLFGTVDEDGTVKNVGVEDSYIKGDENVGAICGNNEGTILNCYNTSIVQGNDNVGAITGAVSKDGVIANSYSVGKATTTGGEEQGVSGVISENVQNCYYLTEKTDNTDSQARTAVEFKSGDVAKSLVEGAPSEFVLEVFNIDNVLPGVDQIKMPDNPDNPPTPVSEVSNSNVRIWNYSNSIVVDNADEDIFVIRSSGVTTKIVSPESSRTEIRISNPGVYIVKTGKVSQKVMIQ